MTMTETPDRTDVGPPDPTPLDQLPLRPPWPWRQRVMGALVVIGAAVVWWSFSRTGIAPATITQGWQDMQNLIERMLPIRFDNLSQTVDLAVETFFIAFLGTALAVGVSVPLAFMAARNTTPNQVAYGLARGVIVAMRSIPDLVFALIFVRAIGIGGVGGIIAGILAIGLHAVGMVAKLYGDAVEQIDEGPREAILATGATKKQSLLTGVFPQVLPAWIGVALYRLDINFRTSTILGYVGAGGIGQLLQLYLSGLRYDRALGVTVVIIVLVLAVEFLSASVRKAVLGGVDPYHDRRLTVRLGRVMKRRRKVDPTDPSEPRTAELRFDPERLTPPWTPERRRMTAFTTMSVITVLVSFVYTRVTPLDLVASTWDILVVGTRLIPGDLDWLTPDLRSAMLETIAMAFASTVIGLTLALPLAFLAARNVAPARLIYYIARTIVVVVRAVPELILAVLFVAALGLGPFPGVIALSIGTIGFGTKLFADSIEEVKQGQRDAIVSTGATRLQEAGTGVTPQVMPALLGTALYILDINVRSSTILGIVGAGGIGFYLIQATRTLQWETVGGIIAMTFVVVYAIERLSGWIRKQLI
ncbi:MAG: phosphonate ABC transporter, permease protein PhnE [Acidimicrobiales bacterium]